MINEKIYIWGYFVSYPSLMWNAKEEERINAKSQGDLFRQYIWGQRGICDIIKRLEYKNYGNDLILILLQFYINPIEYELANLKEIGSYRKNEKSIGIPIIVTVENFFDKSEEERYEFLKQSILQKLELLKDVIKKKKLDTDVDQLKKDTESILTDFLKDLL